MSKRAAEDSSLDSKRPRTEGSSGALHVPAGFNISRARLLTQPTSQALHGDCVVYWMSRDQRARDNYALLYAQSVARSHNVPLRVVFNLVPRFLEATLRQYGFMIKGLKEVEDTLREHNIPFHLLMGDPVTNIPQFLNDRNALMLVTDFSPLRVGAGWVNSVAEKLNNQTHKLPLIQVDAHNIVPCWVASPKLEYSARTFRGKITPKIPEFLQEFPALVHNPAGSLDSDPVKWDEALESLQINRDVGEVDWIRPGAAAASEMLEKFIQQKLKDYGDKRNDPNNDFVSNMSPYTHFGQISVQRIILTLKAAKKSGSSVDSFIEESVVRRELTDNFCFCKTIYLKCFDFFTYNIDSNFFYL